MTLEDFFTLTEMKDGLIAPSRVQELVSVMKKEQDSVVKITGDTMRQWAAVASTIAATENKDCLDLFIQLDGLWFIDKWLTDAQKFGADTNDGFVEESITAMLRAIEKLYLDSEKPITSGIWATVSNLLDHHSSKVQDRARGLFDKWKGVENGDAETHDMDTGQRNHMSDKNLKEEGQLSSVDEASNDNDHVLQLEGGEKSILRSSDTQIPDKVANVKKESSDNAHQSSVSLDCEDNKERSNHLATVLTSVQENAPASEGELTSSGIYNLPVPKLREQPDDLQLNDLSMKEKQELNDNGPAEKIGAPISPKHETVSVGVSEAKVKPVPAPIMPESSLEHKVKSNEDGVSDRVIVSCSMRTRASDRMNVLDGSRTTNSSNPQLSKASVKEEGKSQVSNQGDDTSNGSDSFKQRKDPTSPNIIDKSSDMELEYGIVDALEVARQVAQEVDRKYARSVKEDKDPVSDQDDDTSNSSDSYKQSKGSRSPNIVNKNSNIVNKNSDIELEYGIVDALQVARQVAQEVERELNNSSSEKISEGGIRQAGSPDSVGKNDDLACALPEEVSFRQSNSAEACPEKKHMSVSDDIMAEPECIPDLESSQLTEAAQDPGGNSEKSLCTFDLNEEYGSDDVNVSANTISTTPIPVVSASKPAQTSGLPTAPLQFEGTLGWKGSAATSAFRPASPRKISDNQKTVSAGGNSDISKQRQDFLDFDLNVAGGEEELVKQIGESSSLPSGQSSVEHSPKRSRRFELDLNSAGDDGDNTQPSYQRMEGQLFFGRNGYSSPSPASSSSSMQPSVRNIDLNDRPYFQTDLVDQGPIKSSSSIEAYGLSKSDAPAISILGAKVEVGRREHVPQIWSLPNGKAVEPAMDLTMMPGSGGVSGMGPAVSYNHSTFLGYNGLASMPSLSFSPAAYGSGGTIPYMVDSRGAPVVPQVGGSSSTVLSSYAQPPYIMSMPGTQLGLNGVGPSRPNFDLNSGYLIDGGNRDALATRPFLFPGQSRAMEDRTLQQSSSSGVGGKRKEPDGSCWETYPFGYKHQQPPWK
ncbi:dentin sialophosphoprotein [Trifolium pratense]|uniref:dentin sialophosphoprotein n=1 Tax=Trifolium pratense TaxID=57577 RepID=UPI001E693962|nr:dentin sialophosphoprotein [Trifolium pratense]XP_045803302.1 dentin sialophosphoprotein [Trifolium pratense]